MEEQVIEEPPVVDEHVEYVQESLLKSKHPIERPAKVGRPRLSVEDKAAAKQASRDRMNAARREKTRRNREERESKELHEISMTRAAIKDDAEDVFNKRFNEKLASMDAQKAAAADKERADMLQKQLDEMTLSIKSKKEEELLKKPAVVKTQRPKPLRLI